MCSPYVAAMTALIPGRACDRGSVEPGSGLLADLLEEAEQLQQVVVLELRGDRVAQIAVAADRVDVPLAVGLAGYDADLQQAAEQVLERLLLRGRDRHRLPAARHRGEVLDDLDHVVGAELLRGPAGALTDAVPVDVDRDGVAAFVHGERLQADPLGPTRQRGRLGL